MLSRITNIFIVSIMLIVIGVVQQADESLAAGIMIAAMNLGSQMFIYEQPRSLVFPGEMDVLRVQEIPVDILGAPGTSVISGNQGDIDGGGMDPRNPQNTSLLAPPMGGGTWTQKGDMPTARYGLSTSVVNGIIYAIGGTVYPDGSCLGNVEAYEPATNTWTKKADMPTARKGLSTSVVDGIVYAIGGWTVENWGLSTVEAYDPATDKWTKKADMPTARRNLSTSAVDGIIYAIGGWNGPTDAPFSTVEAYDPATDTWTKKADMPTARAGLSTCVLDKKIYVIGGSHLWDFLSTVEAYDPATDTWTRKADMPTPRNLLPTSVVDGIIYAIGGWNDTDYLSTVEAYNPATDTWAKKADMPTGRASLSTSMVNGYIYAIGGWDVAATDVVEEYVPGLPDNISNVRPAGKLLTTWGKVRVASP